MVLVILMFAICLIEVMDNPVKLLSVQGIYLMYLYLGSIGVIICIYVWVLIDSCVSLTSDETEIVASDSSLPGAFTLSRFNSLKQFSSLKRAHISRSKTSDTSFYLRVGALSKFKISRHNMYSIPTNYCTAQITYKIPENPYFILYRFYSCTKLKCSIYQYWGYWGREL